MKKKDVKDFLWSTIGSVVFGFISLFFLIITTRVNGLEIAGAFTYAFANACVFWTIGSYSGKAFQITEINDEYSDSDFLYNKLTTCIIMIVIAFLFCFITRPSLLKVELIIILTLFRSVDAFIDSIHCIIQRNGELHKVGKSMFLRTIMIILTFFIVDKLFNNVVYASLAILIVNVVYCLFVDFYLIKNKFEKRKYNKKINVSLLKAGFAVCLYSFLAIYISNASKYAINSFSTDDIQALFGIIILPASFLALFSQYLVQPFLNDITKKVKEKDKKGLIKKILIIGSFIVGIGIFAILGCYLLGIPVLEFIYGVTLKAELKNLLIILIGSLFYSLAILFSTIFIALRKTGTQLVLLILTAIFTFFTSKYLTLHYGIDGATYAYVLAMAVEFILHLLVLFISLKRKKETIMIRLMGGLGNQMFQYATLRTQMIKYKQDGIISLKGITNKTHNVYCLNHFNIDKNITIVNKESIKSKLNYLFYGFYCVFLVKRKNGFKIIQKIQPLLNKIGMYCVPDGFVELSKSNTTNNVMVGYYQSLHYFNEYKDVIKKELKVVDPILDKNKNLLAEIEKNNSICVHIRRGDFVGTNHQICDEAYYLKAESIIREKVKNPKFYIFSDDLEWVKEHIRFTSKVYYVEGNNNYEDLRLMYSCKHFIISNSSFSWWAQYLTDNEKRITIAPKKWFQNENQKVDIYEDDWIKI